MPARRVVFENTGKSGLRIVKMCSAICSTAWNEHGSSWLQDLEVVVCIMLGSIAGIIGAPTPLPKEGLRTQKKRAQLFAPWKYHASASTSGMRRLPRSHGGGLARYRTTWPHLGNNATWCFKAQTGSRWSSCRHLIRLQAPLNFCQSQISGQPKRTCEPLCMRRELCGPSRCRRHCHAVNGGE